MAFQQDLNEHLRRLKKGDRQSFKIVYEQYVNALHSFVVRFVKSSTIADDVVQEVFIKIWEKRESIDISKSFQAYLYTIAKNLVLNKLVQSRREISMFQTIMEAAQILSNKTEEDIYFKETTRFIKEGVDKLPPQQKNIYDLCKNQGLTYDQVAERLKLSSHTINAQMVNCLRTLKQYLVSKESSKS